MRYLLGLLLIAVLLSGTCGDKKMKTGATAENNEQAKDPVPSCVRKLIDDESKQSPPNTPVQVDEYSYQGKRVYLITAHCCDQYNMLYDDNCKAICAPSGGFTGRGDGQCKDFDSTAKHVKLIWRDPSK